LPTANGIVVNNAPPADLNNDSSNEQATLANENSAAGEVSLFFLIQSEQKTGILPFFGEKIEK
jgi:hypothetical protein